MANPGYFTIIRVQFDLPTGVTAPQTYVYHCHIVEHEDNDMMRPFTVIPLAAGSLTWAARSRASVSGLCTALSSDAGAHR